MTLADLWFWWELDSHSQASFVGLLVLIRLGLTGSLTMIVLRAAGHVKNYQSYNNNYAPTLHAGLMTQSKGHFSSKPLHSWNYVDITALNKVKNGNNNCVIHFSTIWIKSHKVPAITMPHSCIVRWSGPSISSFQKYAGNMSKCPLSAKIFARRVGVVRTTQMTNSQVCFCHSLQYMMSPLTIDDWRKPSNKQSWSLPLTSATEYSKKKR